MSDYEDFLQVSNTVDDPKSDVGIWPRITIAIPTRNRPDDLRRCLQSLTTVTYPLWDILIVDQSTDLRTRYLVDERAPCLPRVRYVHLDEQGASRSRNSALQSCNADILAFLDDDCTVKPDWLLTVARAFARAPESDLVLGAVRAIPHDPDAVFVPATSPEEERLFRGRLALLRLHRAGSSSSIMSASMYLKVSSRSRLGLFDAQLGPGAGFGIAEDVEYVYRALRNGCAVLQTPAVEVLHYGARTYHDGSASRMFRTVAYASGAADMKLLRCGELPALVMIPVHAAEYLQWIQLGNIVRRRSPTGLAWIVWYIRGLAASFKMQIDRERLLYASEAGRNPESVVVPDKI